MTIIKGCAGRNISLFITLLMLRNVVRRERLNDECKKVGRDIVVEHKLIRGHIKAQCCDGLTNQVLHKHNRDLRAQILPNTRTHSKPCIKPFRNLKLKTACEEMRATDKRHLLICMKSH
jgi:hypothetical protein